MDVQQTAQQLLLAARMKEPADVATGILQEISPGNLEMQLQTDDQKKAFWINIYNAFTQIILSASPHEYRNRHSFFSNKQISVANKRLSLDDIEHGILRRSKIKWSLGYFNKPFASSFEKKQRVDRVDYRIHFALNCGAKSCPPIAFYEPAQIDKQLELATKAYLNSESNYDKTKNIVYLPAIMSWFRGDFGGKKKMKRLLGQLSIIPEDKDPTIHFNNYDWNLFLNNYKSD